MLIIPTKGRGGGGGSTSYFVDLNTNAAKGGGGTCNDGAVNRIIMFVQPRICGGYDQAMAGHYQGTDEGGKGERDEKRKKARGGRVKKGEKVEKLEEKV